MAKVESVSLLALLTVASVLGVAVAPALADSGPNANAAPPATGGTPAGSAGAPAHTAGTSGSAAAGTSNSPAAGGSGGGALVGALAVSACNMGMDKAPEKLKPDFATLAASVCKTSCSGDTLCLRADTGSELCESSPAEIQAGVVLTVKVFGPPACDGTIEISSATRKQLDTIFEATPAAKERAEQNGTAELIELKSAQVTASSDVGVVGLQINFARKLDASSVSSTHELKVLHGYYYVALGALLPVVPGGKRDAEAQAGATDGEPTLQMDPDIYITPALALNIFPFGGKSRGQVFCCRYADRWVQELVGIQLGVGLDFSEPPALFGGVILEPIAGVGLSGGLALIQGDVLNNDATEGMLLRDPSALPVHRTYLPHAYFALTLSLDVLDTVVAAKNKLSGTQVQ